MAHALSGGRPEAENRNCGLDLLKALAMMMVVTLHVMGHGGVLGAAAGHPARDALAWAFESFAYPAVNIYVIITGYLYAVRQPRAGSLLRLWLQVFFYSMLIPIVLKLARFDVDPREIVSGFFPILAHRYWFFTAYFALFCFIPVLNAVAGNERLLRWSLFFSLILFSLLPVLGLGEDLFHTQLGCSLLWFSVLYLTGAWLRRHGASPLLERHGAALFLLSVLLLLLSRIAILRVFGSRESLFFSYASPPVYFAAVCAVVWFQNRSVSAPWARSAVTLLSALSFDVYLIHDHPTFRAQIVAGRFAALADQGLLRMAGSIFAAVLVIFFAGEAIGFLRARLFAALRIRQLADRVGRRLDAVLEALLGADTKK